MWLGVDLRMGPLKGIMEIDRCAQKMLTILDSTFNMIAGEGRGGDYRPLNEHVNLHFDDE